METAALGENEPNTAERLQRSGSGNEKTTGISKTRRVPADLSDSATEAITTRFHSFTRSHIFHKTNHSQAI